MMMKKLKMYQNEYEFILKKLECCKTGFIYENHTC